MKSWTGVVWLTLCLAGCDRAPVTPTTPAPEPASVSTAPATPPPPLSAPPAPAIDTSGETVGKARQFKAEGKLAEARAALQPVADAPDASDAAVELLGEIDTQILFTGTAAPEKVDHTIEAGDTLGKLAEKYGTTVTLIKKSNNLTRDMIRIGDRLRIYQGKFSVDVSKTANTLRLLDSGKLFKRYRVGTGEFSKTPVGEFKVTSRIENPPWWRPDGKTIPFGDPDNILGTHWLGLDVPGYGIHGTWETNSIGKQATAGCIRLLNDDVAELYAILPVGTVVTIHE
jgi:lipoprotein-anchoring transpeptidase ErfK/SrfK